MAQHDKQEETETETLTHFQPKILPSPLASGHKKPRSDPILSIELNRREDEEAEERSAGEEVTRPQKIRCLTCGKRLGLLGFRCRCGDLFCGNHRYSDRHECGFDYKGLGREMIERENPVVRVAKIIRF